MTFKSSRKVFGELAPQFFIKLLEDGRGINPLELVGRSDSAFIDRMTRGKYAASARVVLSEGRFDEREATAATKPPDFVLFCWNLEAIGEPTDLVVDCVRQSNALHHPRVARRRGIAKHNRKSVRSVPNLEELHGEAAEALPGSVANQAIR